jgi:hypothetical protein
MLESKKDCIISSISLEKIKRISENLNRVYKLVGCKLYDVSDSISTLLTLQEVIDVETFDVSECCLILRGKSCGVDVLKTFRKFAESF